MHTCCLSPCGKSLYLASYWYSYLNTTSELVENLQKTIKRFEETMKIQYSHPEDIRTRGFLDCKIY